MALHTARAPPSPSGAVRSLARRWLRECSGQSTPLTRCWLARQPSSTACALAPTWPHRACSAETCDRCAAAAHWRTRMRTRILDAESTGGQISGEVSNASPLPSGEPASWRRLLVGLACVSVLVGSAAGLAIGRSARQTAIAQPDDVPRAPARETPAGPALVTVEELPPPASADTPSAAPPSSADAPPSRAPARSHLPPTAKPVVVKPARSRHRAPSATSPRPKTGRRSGDGRR
jgi:hypothetical protein